MSAASKLGQIRWAAHFCDDSTHHHKNLSERRKCSALPAINIYASEQQFVTRIDHPDDIAFFNRCVIAALKKISEEQAKRRMFRMDEVEAEEVVGAAV